MSAVEFAEFGLHDNLLTTPHHARFALPLVAGYLLMPEGPGLGDALADEGVKAHIIE
ncbi:MAG: hypothetical protein OXH85_00115 [Truepera sp.]|nr:hypothetical protein [Truepera sp.]